MRLAWRLLEIVSHHRRSCASPGNPGIAELADCVPAPDDLAGYADIAEAHGIDLTVVGPRRRWSRDRRPFPRSAI